METFELRSSFNNLIIELNDSVSKENIIKLGIDIQLPNRYSGNQNVLLKTLLFISKYVSKILVNGFINIEILLHSRQNSIVNLRVQIIGQGTMRNADSDWTAMERFMMKSDYEIRYKSDEEQICFDFQYTLLTIEETKIESTLPFNKREILIVEDNEINAMVFSSFVEEWGCESIVAINGAEAISQTHDNTFDVILMDIHMPILNGIQATKKIREFSSIPIIALTASTEEKDIKEAIEAGANDYLLKPISSVHLFQVLSKYL